MSREPESAALRYREALGRSGAPLDPVPKPPPPKPTRPKPGKGKRVKVRVEPKRRAARTREEAFTKWATSTERLTADERALLREIREVSPDAASRSLAAIREAKRRKGKDTR